jgi:hypothetical protein
MSPHVPPAADVARSRRTALALGALLACLAWPLSAAAQRAGGYAHTHGHATMDVALDGRQLSLGLEVPLDSLLGFERPPRTPAERSRADEIVKALRAADGLFRPNAEAGCRLAGVELQSAALGLGKPETAPVDGHAELVAEIRFECDKPAELRQLGVGLFTAWPRLQRVEVQVALPRGQFKRVLKRPDGTLSLKP